MPEKSKKKVSKKTENKNIEKATEIANYYGFNHRKTPEITKNDLAHAKELMVGDYVDPDLANEDLKLPLHVEEKVAILRTYFEEKWNDLPQPVMTYFRGPFKGHINRKASKFDRFCDLEIIGTNKSVAEATLIQTATIMLREAGYEDFYVEINSIGDKDSINQFSKDLINYYKKSLNELCADCRQLMKKDPFEILNCRKDHCKKINGAAPKSMTYLSDTSRNHLREVLEYLEKLGINFRINESLLGNRRYCTETIYEIIENKNGEKGSTLAIGIRYDNLSKKIELKRDLPSASISLLIKGGQKNELSKPVKKARDPLVYFLQLGFEAKLLSLKIIEILRQIKIPVYQALSRDKLTSQMAVAEKLKIPYTIIIGKKEALENTAIVKRMDNHSQETVHIDNLASYMKKMIGSK